VAQVRTLYNGGKQGIHRLIFNSLLTSIVKSTYLNMYTCKFELSQTDWSRAESTDSSQAYRKPRASTVFMARTQQKSKPI